MNASGSLVRTGIPHDTAERRLPTSCLPMPGSWTSLSFKRSGFNLTLRLSLGARGPSLDHQRKRGTYHRA